MYTRAYLKHGRVDVRTPAYLAKLLSGDLFLHDNARTVLSFYSNRCQVAVPHSLHRILCADTTRGHHAGKVERIHEKEGLSSPCPSLLQKEKIPEHSPDEQAGLPGCTTTSVCMHWND